MNGTVLTVEFKQISLTINKKFKQLSVQFKESKFTDRI